MIIMRIMGGLGNQMFQYALYRKLKYLGKDVKIDIQLFDDLIMHNGFELSRVFDLQPAIASKDEVLKYGDTKRDFLSRLRRKVGLRKKSHFIPSRALSVAYLPQVMKMDEVYLDGYWQSEKYFKDIEDIIRNDFAFKTDLSGKNALTHHDILQSESIGVHVRRGDYLNIPLHQDICDLDYYTRAIGHMSKMIDNPAFFVFSDDIDWCKSNLPIENAVYVDSNKRKDSYIDMQLMSACKHNIIANSSFSWWAAWLNRNLNKKIIAPDKWFNDDQIQQSDIVPDGWIRAGALI